VGEALDTTLAELKFEGKSGKTPKTKREKDKDKDKDNEKEEAKQLQKDIKAFLFQI